MASLKFSDTHRLRDPDCTGNVPVDVSDCFEYVRVSGWLSIVLEYVAVSKPFFKIISYLPVQGCRSSQFLAPGPCRGTLVKVPQDGP